MTSIEFDHHRRVADIGGPVVDEHTDLGRIYLANQGSRRRVVGVPSLGLSMQPYPAPSAVEPELARFFSTTARRSA